MGGNARLARGLWQEGAVGGGSPISPIPYWEMSSVSLSMTFPRNSTRGGAAIVFKSCPFSNVS